MRVPNSSPTLSLAERDRRYKAVRERLKEKKLDCIIAADSNLFYLTNGLPGEHFGLLTTAEEPLLVVIHHRYLVDIPKEVVTEAQDWVKDVAAGNNFLPIIQRLRALKLDKGNIGVTGLNVAKVGTGGMSIGLREQLFTELPNAKIVDASDIFADLRTLKSAEEVAMFDKANHVFDAAVRAVHQSARVGITGAQAVHAGIAGMWQAGGDVESMIDFNFARVPRQNPVLAEHCLSQVIKQGDVGTITGHSAYLGYPGHSDQEISFGAPSALHKELFQVSLRARDEVLKVTRPGTTHGELLQTYQRAVIESGFRPSAHSQIHQYGIDVPEFPGPSFIIAKDLRQDSGLQILDSYYLLCGGDFELKPGMIYSISPTVVAKNSDDTILGGTTVAITDSGYRELGSRAVEFLVAEA